ncbi:MAG: serine protease [Phycisphaeraceae bacterium]|nr:MAG: serine protease [Phycisphaeraceae bacterium]
MPTWSGILNELISATRENGLPPFDVVRRKYLVRLSEHTGRPVILYATRFTQDGVPLPPDLVSITEEDGQGLMEVVHGLSGGAVDIILHSPGGSPMAAEAMVCYLRSKFNDIRVVVPHLAMSAATMIACAADVIVLGKHSFLGPTDPQIILQTALGARMVPAHAILIQFEQAIKECSDPTRIGAYLPMLPQYGPDLLATCSNVIQMSEGLVASWLRKYMFRGDAAADRKATEISKWLSDHPTHGVHSRHLSRDELEAKGLKIQHLEQDQTAQDLFLSVFHATTHTFSGTTAVKIIENNLGRAFIKQVQMSVPAQGHEIPRAAQAPIEQSRTSRAPVVER